MRLYLATFIMVDSKIKPEICPEDNVKLYGIFEKEATAIEVIVEDILQDRLVKKAITEPIETQLKNIGSFKELLAFMKQHDCFEHLMPDPFREIYGGFNVKEIELGEILDESFIKFGN